MSAIIDPYKIKQGMEEILRELETLPGSDRGNGHQNFHLTNPYNPEEAAGTTDSFRFTMKLSVPKGLGLSTCTEKSARNDFVNTRAGLINAITTTGTNGITVGAIDLDGNHGSGNLRGQYPIIIRSDTPIEALQAVVDETLREVPRAIAARDNYPGMDMREADQSLMAREPIRHLDKHKNDRLGEKLFTDRLHSAAAHSVAPGQPYPTLQEMGKDSLERRIGIQDREKEIRNWEETVERSQTASLRRIMD